jgi:hypothetical protein
MELLHACRLNMNMNFLMFRTKKRQRTRCTVAGGFEGFSFQRSLVLELFNVRNAFSTSVKASFSPLLPCRCRLALGSMLLLQVFCIGIYWKERVEEEGESPQMKGVSGRSRLPTTMNGVRQSRLLCLQAT